MHRAASPSLGAATTLALLVLVSATGGPFGDRLGERAVDGRPHAQPARAPAFPPRSDVAQARRYLAHRGGSVSFALIDSRGRLYGYAPRRRYVSASVTKAMMLVAYLRAIGDRHPSAAERAELGPMIMRSDNARADTVYRWVGDARLRSLAARAGMRWFSVSGYWGYAQVTAEDQARFFRRIDLLVPRAQPGLRAPAPLLDRPLAAVGVLPRRAPRGLQDLPEGRVAQYRRRPPGARGRAVPARVRPLLDGGDDRRESHPRLRHGNAARRGTQDLPPRTPQRRARPPPGRRRCAGPACGT